MAREKIQSVKGMNDFLPPETSKWQAFERACCEHFERFGYREVRTPILESTALFSRGIGEVTDVVEKQMYTFADKSKKARSLTMRPEMTASCARAYIEHAVAKKEPVTRWYYIGPMFRYENVQAGRYRQFHQIGVEAFGVAEPTIDAEQIAMLYQVYTAVGIGGLDVVINSVGDDTDRGIYRAALLEYLRPRAAELCGDCQRRLETNPLRVLDCKKDAGENSELLATAPSILEHLSPKSTEHFDGVRAALDAFGVPFRVDARLVRGLDYYSGTVFEIISNSNALGSQASVVGGGRYDGLIESLGGPQVPAVGFALGLERNVMCIEGDDASFSPVPDVFIAALGDEARRRAMAIAHELRGAGLSVELEHRNVGAKSQFKRADKLGARFVATLGERELEGNVVNLKNMATGAQEPIAIARLAEALSLPVS